jgi:beta-glucosidase
LARTDADRRAEETERQMTDEERFALLVSVMGANIFNPVRDDRIPDGVPMSAGYVPGVPRLGVPALLMTDASLGITNQGYREGDTATALPAGLALGASFNPALARASGAMLGREARSRGFNVLLAGGINLARDPRNGRNFEYLSEDPLLSAVLAAESIGGIQAEGVISTIKHFSLNCNETNRHWLDARIDPDAHRESDLLAFEIAIERSQPGSVMTGYNKVNGEYAGGNRHLLLDVLKGDWGYAGWVMSDWGATPTWEFALAGLDQESGAQIDRMLWNAEPFTGALREAHAAGALPAARLSEMVRRILRSIYAVGVDAWADPPPVAMDEHNRIALETARQGIVLLANDGVLPLAAQRIAVIGGHAQVGVPAGTGSSAVVPPGGYAEVIKIGGPGVMGVGRNLYLLPSSPLAELRERLPDAAIEFDPGMTPAEAALAARQADVAIVFAIRVEGEGFDSPDLSLPWGQDAVIAAVAEANPNTVVVLETGNPVAMPWRDDVRAILAAWYPGQAGGQAIAEVLTGAVNPSGRLPITFPAGLAQTPRPDLPGLGTPWGTAVTIAYDEGAEIGYRWFAQRGETPLFAFGHGLSYTTFAYDDLVLTGGDTLTATFTVTNTGTRAGADVPQLYLTGPRTRLLAFERVELAPGDSRRVSLAAEPRLLARFRDGRWAIDDGDHRVAVATSATAPVLTGRVALDGRSL